MEVLVEPGRLRQVITVKQLASETFNADGSVTRAYTAGTSWRAHVVPLSGREFIEAKQIGSELTHRVTMRFFDGLTPKDQIVFDSRALEIDHVINVEEFGVMTIALCKEVTS